MTVTRERADHGPESEPGATTVAEPAPIIVADEAALTTVVNESSGRPRHDLPVLEAYRGLAAVMVVFTHVGFISGAGIAGAWAGWLSRLDFGVALFFLLSGLLLFRPFVQAAYSRRPGVSIGSYLRRRYVRIYPAFIVVLAFNYLITPAARDAGVSMWVNTLLMTQNYQASFVNQLPGLVQAWSLAVEVSFYLALPLLAWLILGRGTTATTASEQAVRVRRQRLARTPAQIRQAALDLNHRPLPTRALARVLRGRVTPVSLAAQRPILILGALSVVALGWRYYYMLQTGGLDNQLLWLPAFLDWFAAGMALAWLRERDTPVPQALRDIANTPGACWSLGLAGFWLTTTELGGPYGLEGPSAAQATLKHLVFLVVAVLLLLPAVFGDGEAGWRRVARNRFFSWLGRISFGVFLWHPMLMGAIRRLLRMDDIGGGFWLTLTLTLLASAVAGTLSWRFIEAPLQRRWRNGFRADKNAAPASRRRVLIRRPQATTASPAPESAPESAPSPATAPTPIPATAPSPATAPTPIPATAPSPVTAPTPIPVTAPSPVTAPTPIPVRAPSPVTAPTPIPVTATDRAQSTSGPAAPEPAELKSAAPEPATLKPAASTPPELKPAASTPPELKPTVPEPAAWSRPM
jgi:peptidoglycan/LPS O-acetylase OafA/YrhL